MICNKCGQEMSANDRFCQHCGAPAAQESAPSDTEILMQQADHTTQETCEPISIPTEPTTPPESPTIVGDPGASTGKTAYILGLIGLIAGSICTCGCSLLGGLAPLVCCILAIVLGNQAREKSAAAGIENHNAKTAVTLGIIGIAVIVIFVIINIVVAAVMGSTDIYSSVYSSI